MTAVLLMLLMPTTWLMGRVNACNSSTLMSCLQLDAVDLFDRFTNHSFFPAYDNDTLDAICRSVCGSATGAQPRFQSWGSNSLV